MQTDYGDVFHCVDIDQQPAFDHPLLKNHKIQVFLITFLYFVSHACFLIKCCNDLHKLRWDLSAHFAVENHSVFYSLFQATPSFSLKKKINKVGDKSGIKIGLNGTSCPIGTVPIRRIREGELLAARRQFTSRMNSTTRTTAAAVPNRIGRAKDISIVSTNYNFHTWNDDNMLRSMINLIVTCNYKSTLYHPSICTPLMVPFSFYWLLYSLFNFSSRIPWLFFCCWTIVPVKTNYSWILRLDVVACIYGSCRWHLLWDDGALKYMGAESRTKLLHDCQCACWTHAKCVYWSRMDGMFNIFPIEKSSNLTKRWLSHVWAITLYTTRWKQKELLLIFDVLISSEFLFDFQVKPYKCFYFDANYIRFNFVQVNPAVFGDSRSRLYVSWTVSSYH